MRFAAVAFLAALAGCVPPATEAPAPAPAPAPTSNPMVGGAVMDPARTIFQNAAASRDHTTFVAAVRAAGLEGTLSGPGPYTVFAPTNAAFDKLPPMTVDTLMHPANKGLLARVIGYHIVPGRKTGAQIAADARAGGASAAYRTSAGATIRAGLEGNRIVLRDVNNGRSDIGQADVVQSNGVMHVVASVLLPPLN